MGARSLENLHRDEADETEADDDYPVAQLNLGRAHAVKRYGPHAGEGCGLKSYALRYLDGQAARNGDDLTVGRLTGPEAGDAVAHLEVVYRSRHLYDVAGAAVTQRHGRIQASHSGAVRLSDAVYFGLVDHLTHQVRSASGLTQQTLLGQVHHQFFRADAHQRSHVLHQHAIGAQGRNGHLVQR